MLQRKQTGCYNTGICLGGIRKGFFKFWKVKKAQQCQQGIRHAKAHIAKKIFRDGKKGSVTRTLARKTQHEDGKVSRVL